MLVFTTRNGEVKKGLLVHQYTAFEGEVRYILRTSDGREYRCVKRDGELVELVC